MFCKRRFLLIVDFVVRVCGLLVLKKTPQYFCFFWRNTEGGEDTTYVPNLNSQVISAYFFPLAFLLFLLVVADTENLNLITLYSQ